MISNTKQGHEIYGHAQYNDVQVRSIKQLYAQYRHSGSNRTHTAAICELHILTGYDYHDLCSVVAKHKVADIKKGKVDKYVYQDTQLTFAF